MKRIEIRVLAGALLAMTVGMAAASDAPPVASQPAVDAAVMGIGLNVADLDRSLEFYTKGLGMIVLATLGPPEHKETFLGFDRDPAKPRFMLLSGTAVAAGEHASHFGRVVFRAGDVTAIQTRLRAAGYQASEINTVPSGHKVLLVSDPDGHQLEFVTSPGR